jgi:hypothetical protein
MANFCPLLEHISVTIASETKRDLKRVGGVTQHEPHELTSAFVVSANHSAVREGGGCVAIRVHHLKRRLPNVTVASLRVGLVNALRFTLSISRTNPALVKPPIGANLEAECEVFGSNTQRTLWQSRSGSLAGCASGDRSS